MIIRASDSDDLPADARSGDGAAFGAHVAGSDDHHHAVIPGSIDPPYQCGILSHISAGKGTYGNVDDADVPSLPVFANPAKSG